MCGIKPCWETKHSDVRNIPVVAGIRGINHGKLDIWQLSNWLNKMPVNIRGITPGLMELPVSNLQRKVN